MEYNYSELFGGFPKAEVAKDRSSTAAKKKGELMKLYRKYNEEMVVIRDLVDKACESGHTHINVDVDLAHDDVKVMLKVLGYEVYTPCLPGDHTVISWR